MLASDGAALAMTHTTTTVPFLDLGAQRDEIADEVAAGFAAVLADNSFVLGPAVADFEDAYAAYSGVQHCVGVGNGTDALELALRAADIGPGDEVILPANTFIATAEAVTRVGASVVLVDCRSKDLLIDVDACAAARTARTRAVVPVHLYGQLADVPAIRRTLGPDVLIVEDAAQSQGAQTPEGFSGALGDIASTSFYPGKNLGAYGDAGAVTTDDPWLAEAVRKLRNHGGTVKYEHGVVGMNSRMDSLQAVVLRAKLRHLDRWNAQRRAVAWNYDRLLTPIPEVKRPVGVGTKDHVWHLYVIRVPKREHVLASLTEQGVGVGVHYPVPIHLTPAYAHLGMPRGAFPVAENAAREVLSLPMYPQLGGDDQQRVVAALEVALRGNEDAERLRSVS
jgi:dTDP-4-amino-4,6-dideoxygalactose transaminase